MTITAEGLRSRRRRACLSQDIPTVNHNNCCQNGLSLQQIYTLRPAGLRTPWRSQPCSHPLPTCIEHLVAENSTDIAQYSRELDYLFALSAIGVSGLTSGWSQYTGEAICHSSSIIYSF